MEIELETRRFSADEVRQMLDVGVIAEDEPLELLEGRLVVVTPQNPRHSYVTTLVARRLREAYGDSVSVLEEKPIDLSPDSNPEPDVAVVRGELRDYIDRHPGSNDVLLVVEVAQTSLSLDRAKAKLYALAGIPEYWIIDLTERRIEVSTEPRTDGHYRVVQVLGENDLLSPPECETSWEVASLLP